MEKFAVIKHIDDIRQLVEDNSESFYIADKGDYLVANYKSIMAAFPNLDEGDHAKVLRELRGIIFDAATGKIIRRPLHKFFNYGERTEYQPEVLAQKKIVGVYDKLDGSMVGAFRTHDGVLRIGTKMGETHMTDDLKTFVARNPKYWDFMNWTCDNGLTAIFEYMAPKHRIVVNHSEEKMVLLAVRDNITGEYLPYGDAI